MTAYTVSATVYTPTSRNVFPEVTVEAVSAATAALTIKGLITTFATGPICVDLDVHGFGIWRSNVEGRIAPARTHRPETLEEALHEHASTMVRLGVDMAALYGEPKTTDYCMMCNESPESGSHLPSGHTYVDPRYNSIATVPVQPYRCNVPMCGESGVCGECRARGAR
jgi:hypothetical protein